MLRSIFNVTVSVMDPCLGCIKFNVFSIYFDVPDMHFILLSALWSLKYFRLPTVRLSFYGVHYSPGMSRITSWKSVQCTNPVGSQRVYILFWQWPQLLIVEQVLKIFLLTCIPGRLPWTGECAMVMLSGFKRRPTTQVWDLLGLTYVYSPVCGAVSVSNPPGHQVIQAYWEPSVPLLWREKCPSTHAGVPSLCWNNPKSSKTAEQANRRLLMLTLELQRNPQS